MEGAAGVLREGDDAKGGGRDGSWEWGGGDWVKYASVRVRFDESTKTETEQAKKGASWIETGIRHT